MVRSGIYCVLFFFGLVTSVKVNALTFDFETASGSGTTSVTQTVSGVTLTATMAGGADTWLVTNGGGISGTSANVLTENVGSGVTSHSFSFSSAVDISSMRLADSGTVQTLVFTPSSGTTYNKDLTSAGEDFSPADWVGITSFTVTLQGGGNFADTIYDTVVFTISNSAPTLGGTPADDTATEDVATAIDLSAYNVADADGDTVTLTLAVDRGTIASIDGNGTTGGVTIANSGTTSMTYQGLVANLNTYLNDTSKTTFTTALNDTTTAVLTVTPNDGTENGAADTVNISITPVNDNPTVSTLPTVVTVTEDTQSNVAFGAALFADVDSASITVTLTASAGTFSTPADGAGVGGGVTETLVSPTVITLAGAPVDINTYLDTASNIQYTGASNVSGNNAATITVTGNDGDGSGNVSLGAVNIDITAVNDDPGVSTLPTDVIVTEDAQSNINLSAASFADVDSASITVTLTASAGSYATPADGAGVGGGVTETLVSPTVVTLVGAPADINTYLDTASNIQYTGASNVSGNNVATITVTGNDGDGSGNVSLGTVNIDITAVNDDPGVSTLPTDVTVTEDTQSNVALGAASFADVDSATITVTLTASAGSFAAPADGASVGGGVTETLVSPTVVTLVGAPADINTYLDTASNIQYTGGGNVNGNDVATITVTANDGDGSGNVSLGTVNVDSTEVGDTPSVTGATTNEDTQSTGGLVISRNGVDSTAVTHFKITNISGGSLFKNDGTTTITNNQFITFAEGNAGLKFTPTADSTTNGTFDVQAGTDGVGGGLSASAATATISITPVNDAPTLTNLNGDSVTFGIGGSGVVLDVSGNATLSDIDSTDFSGGNVTVSITANGQAGEDVLQIGTVGNISTSGSDVVHADGAGTTIGAFTGGAAGASLVVTLNANATVARVRDLVSAMQYNNNDSATVNTTTRTVRITLNDGDGGSATSANQDVTVNLLRAPIIDLDGDNSSGNSSDGYNGTFTENGGAVVTADADSVISDDGTFKSLAVTLTNILDGTAETLSSTYGTGSQTVNGEAVTIGVYNTGTGVISITVDDSSTDDVTMQMLIESIQYNNTSEAPNTTNRTISFVGTDNADNVGPSSTATITVVAVNDAPTTVADTDTTNEDTAVVVDVLANDSDVDGTLVSASVSVASGPSNGTASINTTTGEITYTPAANYNGADSFSYTVEDNLGLASSATAVNIAVNAVNDPPVAVADTVSTFSGTLVSVDVAVNDTDVDTGDAVDPATINVVGAPSNGTAVFNGATNKIDYTPSGSFSGSDSFTYTIDDGNGATSNAATVTVAVAVPNAVPSISGSPATAVKEDSSYSFTPSASDADGEKLTFSIVNKPAWALFNAATGKLSGTPTLNDIGSTSSIVISVTDGKATSSLASFNLQVIEVNDKPVPSSPLTSGVVNQTYRYTHAATDEETPVEELVFAAIKVPSWAVFNLNDLQLRGTPRQAGEYEAILTVSDGVNTVETSFTITVTGVANNEPVISGIAPSAGMPGQLYTFKPTASDADDDVLTFLVSGAPTWLNFDTQTGLLSGTPDSTQTGLFSNIVISVTDGIETVSLAPFSISIGSDLDGDGIIDEEDEDMDGDGIDNVYEIANGLDPRDPADASQDLDGDGRDNLDEYLQGKSLILDDVSPVVTAPESIFKDATGLFTQVSSEELGLASALDVLDGTLPTVSDASTHFQPGVNVVVWSAIDSAGNKGEDVQLVAIVPLVEMSKNQTLAEGASGSFDIILNGDAVTYPVTVPYVVSGNAETDGSDHSLVSGEAVIESGRTATVNFSIADDGVGEAIETIEVQIENPTNAVTGPNGSHTITVVEGNVAPQVNLQAVQGDVKTLLVTNLGGLVEVTANILDPNPLDSHQVDWSGSDNNLIDTDAQKNTFTFDPSTLSVGVYKVIVHVSDGEFGSSSELKLNVVSEPLQLSNELDSDNDGQNDKDEGFGDTDDDGIPDFLDNANLARNVVQERQAEDASFLMETEPGLLLTLGEVAFRANGAKTQVTENDILNHGNEGQGAQKDDEAYEYHGGLFDFNIKELPVAGQSVSIVVAQFSQIPPNAVYRKLMPSGWQDFVINDNNTVASAPGAEGFCPPPGNIAYINGLAEGHWCVQLTIEDGGPNDADGEVNQAIGDPGGVATLRTSDVAVNVSSGGGGGGSFGAYGLALLLLVGMRRQVLRRWLLAAALVAASSESHAWYIGDSFGTSSGDDSLSDINNTLQR